MSIWEKLCYGIIIAFLATFLVFHLSPMRFLVGYGHSMEPLLNEGDGLIVLPVNPQNVDEGDIVAFREDGKTIVHKVIGFEDGKIITHGVNLPKDDVERVSSHQLIGRHVLTVPYVGHILVRINSIFGFLILLLIPGALVVYTELKKIRNELRSSECMNNFLNIFEPCFKRIDIEIIFCK